MSGWSGRSKGGTLGYRFFLMLIRVAPLAVPYFFLRFVALWYLLFSNKAPLRFYFRSIHGYATWKIPGLIYRNYCQLGEVLIDKVAMLSGAHRHFQIEYDGEEYLHEMSRAGKGGVLIGAHMGNWEVAGQLLDRIDTPVNIVMHEAERASISKLLENAMSERQFRIISMKDDYSHLYRIREAFRNREFVVLHGDRFLPGTSTMELPFMGHPAHFPTGPLYLASKNGVPVSFVFTLKEGKGYHFYATPPRIYPYPSRIKTRNQDMRAMLEDYVRVLEEKVRSHPLQWFNFYPFWSGEQKEIVS